MKDEKKLFCEGEEMMTAWFRVWSDSANRLALKRRLVTKDGGYAMLTRTNLLDAFIYNDDVFVIVDVFG